MENIFSHLLRSVWGTMKLHLNCFDIFTLGANDLINEDSPLKALHEEKLEGTLCQKVLQPRKGAC